MVDIETGTDGILTPQLARVVGRKTGLVSTLSYALQAREDPNPDTGIRLHVDVADPAAVSDATDDAMPVTASGKGRTVREGVVSGVGEAIERYCMTCPAYEDRTTASYDDLSAEYDLPDPEYLRYFSDAERERIAEHYKRLDDFDPSEEREWLFGTNLVTGERTCLPSGVLTRARNEEKPPLVPVTTNGMCCHETYERATLGSIFEFVERDAFMRTWYTRTPPTRLEIDGLETRNEAYEYHLFEYDVGVDLPLVGCLGQQQDGNGSFVCGGAGPDIETAVRDSLCEATQCFESTVHRGDSTEAETREEIDPAKIANLEDNVAYYNDTDGLGELAFLLDGPELEKELADRRRDENPSTELERVVDVLENEGVTPIAFDLTPPAIADIGLVVTRVFIPELVPLSLPSFPFDAHPKLEDRIETDAPHPYP